VISFCCISCHSRFKVSNDKAGRRTACPECQALLTVPETHNAEDPGAVANMVVERAPTPSHDESEKVGVLCEHCFRVFAAQPSSLVRCPNCDAPCVTASLEEAARAVEEAKSGPF